MWKPIVKVIDKLYDKYGTKQKISFPQINIHSEQMVHLEVNEGYDPILYSHMIDEPYFEETIKNILIDKISENIPLKQRGDWLKGENTVYSIEMWVRTDD